MAYPKSVTDTVEEMKKGSSMTLDWDVVVNYTESDINDLLYETFQDKSKAQLTEIKCRIKIPDIFNPSKYVYINYDFKLAAPLLNFNSRNAKGPSCNLSFPVVDGTARAEGGDPAIIRPGRYSLVLGTLKLATAKGAADPDTKSYDQPFVIPDEGSKQGCVVIDLPTSEDLTVDIKVDRNSSVPEIPILDSFIPNVCAAIKELLTAPGKAIRYEIARVKAIPPPSGTIQLKPKSFRFHAFLPSEAPKPTDAGVLTLFIQTRTKNDGMKEGLATEWERMWRNTLKCSPIPTSQTASIIFSKDMIYEIVFKPAIEAKKYTGTLENSKGGMKMKINIGETAKRQGVNKIVKGKFGSSVRYYTAAVSKYLPPLELTLSEHADAAVYTLAWKFDYSFEWATQALPGVGTPPAPMYGTVKATHTIPKDSNKHAKLVTFLDDYSFKLDCSVSKDDWGDKFEAEDPSGWEGWLGKSGVLPDWVKSVHVDLPTFDLPLQSVNFFLTTNLLFPGDKQVIDINKTSGLHIPADLYLVGKVKIQ
ncbi:hypothetical protein L210DRAFT_3560446 [Boletus edulis BED1]|uniref:Uncharacterized protein n=1 Tax=Boletus edulis BED1 TaxID=1328754 RepID=A0AAD4BIH1_BOLED|nr:hypothetical protein L210DRAFT_3560446 [Boletus edulis BED1]